MADYRQFCGYPGCTSTGFSPHSAECRADSLVRRNAELAEEKKKQDEIDAFWKGLGSDEAIFTELEECYEEIRKAQFWTNRRNQGLDYLRKTGKIDAYLTWRRKNE